MSETTIDVRVYPINEPKGGTMAFANISVGDIAAIRGVRVIDSEKGLFVSMPQSQDNNGEYHDIAFPLTGDLRKEISEAVLDEYSRVSALSTEERGYDTPDKSAADRIDAADIKLEVRVYPLDKPKSGTKAFASVSMDDIIAIRGVRVVDGQRGPYVVMPQSKDKDGEYRDIAFPLNGDLRKEISKAILREYKENTKSLSDGLKKGAEKAAGHGVTQKDNAAKVREAVLA